MQFSVVNATLNYHTHKKGVGQEVQRAQFREVCMRKYIVIHTNGIIIIIIMLYLLCHGKARKFTQSSKCYFSMAKTQNNINYNFIIKPKINCEILASHFNSEEGSAKR